MDSQPHDFESFSIDGRAHASAVDIGPVSVPANRLVLVVAGGHLQAEVEHRARADGLAAMLRASLDDGFHVVTLTDLWYLNDDRLRSSPVVSVGGPRVNALTTFLGDKVPTAFAVDGQYQVQLDLENRDPVAAVWGIDGATTLAACDVFEEKYLDAFVKMVEREA